MVKKKHIETVVKELNDAVSSGKPIGEVIDMLGKVQYPIYFDRTFCVEFGVYAIDQLSEFEPNELKFVEEKHDGDDVIAIELSPQGRIEFGKYKVRQEISDRIFESEDQSIDFEAEVHIGWACIYRSDATGGFRIGPSVFELKDDALHEKSLNPEFIGITEVKLKI